MNKFAKQRRTRLKATVLGSVLLSACCVAAIRSGMEILAVTCVTNEMLLLGTYIFNQTKRPSSIDPKVDDFFNNLGNFGR